MEGFSPFHLWEELLVTQEKQGGEQPPPPPTLPQESLLRAECFYVQVGGKESVRASEGNALILTLNLLQFPALPHPSHLWQGSQHVAKIPSPHPALWYCAWCFMLNSLPCAWEPWGARAQHQHQVQTFPPISLSGKEEGAQLEKSQKGKQP